VIDLVVLARSVLRAKKGRQLFLPRLPKYFPLEPPQSSLQRVGNIAGEGVSLQNTRTGITDLDLPTTMTKWLPQW